MKTWQQSVHQLPIRVRPVRGETLISYLMRLAVANEYSRPTTLLRALGEPSRPLLNAQLADFDVVLNKPAKRRLETLTGRTVLELRRSLSALWNEPSDRVPTDTPAIEVLRSWNLRDHCDRCVARLPGRPTVRVYSLSFPHICKRHQRWVATEKEHSWLEFEPKQVDLTGAPEIVRAHRRYARLRAEIDNHGWTAQQLRAATTVAVGWGRTNYRKNKALHDRWDARKKAIKSRGYAFKPTPLLVFPEAVALTEVLTDLEWRRHVAMVREERHLDRFYQHVARRLNQPKSYIASLAITDHRPDRPHRRRMDYITRDPLANWARQLRYQHEKLRTEFWAEHTRSSASTTPFPEIRHFE
jgi:hypothetical protein